MSEQSQPHPALMRGLRIFVIAAAVAQTLFWIYTWYYIITRTNPRGDGMELVATVPLTMIFLLFAAIPFMNAVSSRAPRLSAVLVIIGVVANAFLFSEIVAELGGKSPS
jgi:hypothetical protein